jgi:hypothetical protein
MEDLPPPAEDPLANDDEVSRRLRLRLKIEELRRELQELEQQLQALEEVKEPKPKKAKLDPGIAEDAAAAAGPSNSGNVPSLRSEEDFFEDGEGSLKFGEISTFYEGLDGFLGPPNPNLRVAMENEHCNSNLSKDATAIFRVEAKEANYYTYTTSELEYWFVVDPTDEKLEVLRFVRSPCALISLRASLIRSPSDLPACLCVTSLFAARRGRWTTFESSVTSAKCPNGPPSRNSTACRSARRAIARN